MLTKAQFEAVVAQANLAPSIHNAQPARWRQSGDVIEIAADRGVSLPLADPTGAHVGLSCGAAVEATIMALSTLGMSAQVTDHWDDADTRGWPGCRMVARLELSEGAVSDPLAAQIEKRFTWRGAFSTLPVRLFGWSRGDAVFVMDAPVRGWLAQLNDQASLQILRHRAFRRELLSWMRLSPAHPRYRYDGLSRDALHLDRFAARRLGYGFGPLWLVLHAAGKTAAMTAEADLTLTAPLIVCFHRPIGESAVSSGRAYLRLCLEAAHLGLAGWPMAALTDDPDAAAQISVQLAIGPDRQLIQVLRFGVPTGTPPPRARRPLQELISTPLG
tara:strand:- start:10841 stop:11830 length:990 start_codon:yes stop_codon:yes gene_type:complete